MSKRGYKRSWKNLLLDRHYQLGFTLILVLSSAVIIGVLGWLVLDAAGDATSTDIQQMQAREVEGILAPEVARANIARLQERQLWFVIGLVAMGLALCVGLFIFGIKTTHKVSGPLFKISGYLNKLRAGTFAPVYNLRKGDQLAEFYEHFREAHATLRRAEEDDVAALRQVIAVVESRGVATSPGVEAPLGLARARLAEKEAGLG